MVRWSRRLGTAPFQKTNYANSLEYDTAMRLKQIRDASQSGGIDLNQFFSFG
jgi:hypothetical protein